MIFFSLKTESSLITLIEEKGNENFYFLKTIF